MAAGTTGGDLYSGSFSPSPTLDDFLGVEPSDEDLESIEADLGGMDTEDCPPGYTDEAEEALRKHKSEHRASNAGSFASKSKVLRDGIESNGWQDFANCLGTDPELFFPERGASTREAKEVCKGCAVREDCLGYAMSKGERFGIWGGLSERERRRIRSQRAIARRKELEQEVAKASSDSST
ncbi:MAG TPA: WhiB family transcriptional regulator [Candidatus Saccharimonadales bacterium]|nr:WhiB family transcriptional regulator [Candidatus Saccharimonadales bacterium]